MDGIQFIGTLITATIFSLWIAVGAKKRGKSFGLWFVISFFISPIIAGIILLCITKDYKSETPAEPEENVSEFLAGVDKVQTIDVEDSAEPKTILKKPREPFSIKKLIKPSLLLLLLIIIVVVCILLYKKSHESSKSYNFDYGEVSESSSEKGTLTPKNTNVKNSSTNTQKSSTAQKSSNIQLQQLMAVRENLKLRAGESTSTNVIAIMAVGDKVKILEIGKSEKIDGINSSWVKVEVQSGAKDLDGKSIPAGTVGWCYGGYLTKNLNMRQDFDVAFIKVKGGTFKMGSDTIGDDDEKPAHSVTVSSFNLMKTEVTQEFYESVMGHNPSTWSVGQKFPVTDVSWYDAVEFCNKWSELDGLEPCYTINKNRKDPNNYAERDDKKWIVTWNRNANGYRLPTEAEWEYAAKGGVYNRNYTFSGSDDIDEVGWYLENAGGLHNVATKKPNDLGFYDMTGNAGEWCWDWRENYSGKSEIDPTGPAIGERRVLRSGSVYIYASWCRVTNREGIEPNQTGLDMGCMGIRVAKNE